MTLEVLISCMHQEDSSLVTKTNISSNALLINQCALNKHEEYYNKENHLIRIRSTTERGLSKSRNLALHLAQGDVCILCDDDEVLDDDYASKILSAFELNPKADIICFAIKGTKKKFFKNRKTIGFLSALKISSWQIAFRREKIVSNKIFFDETVGSGVSRAGGEENIFLYSCLKHNLRIIYLPVYIGTMHAGPSQWFKGFNEQYFFERGVATRKMMGKFRS